jgi:hypothetical protein
MFPAQLAIAGTDAMVLGVEVGEESMAAFALPSVSIPIHHGLSKMIQSVAWRAAVSAVALVKY